MATKTFNALWLVAVCSLLVTRSAAAQLTASQVDAVSVSASDLIKTVTLSVQTCGTDFPNAVSNDPIEASLALGQSVEVRTLPAATTYGGTVSATFLAWGIGDVRSLTIRKRGNDAWCIKRAWLTLEGKVIWSHPSASADAHKYIGPHPFSKVIWLDGEIAHAPAPSVRFSDIFILGTDSFPIAPFELEFHTCTSAISADGKTDDPVEVTVKRDSRDPSLGGLYPVWESFVLDNPGNDREFNAINRYRLDDAGMGILGTITVRKRGVDRWCFDRISAFIGGVEVWRSTSKVLINASTSSEWSEKSFAASFGNVTGIVGYPGLPMMRSPSWTQPGYGGQNQPCRKAANTDPFPNLCNAGLACQNGTCVTSGDVDQPCNEAEFTFSLMADGSVKAVPVPACDPPNFSSLPELTCVQGTCLAPGDTHAPCIEDAPWIGACNDARDVCVGGYCERPATLWGEYGGRVDCAYGDASCNRCAHRVEDQFKNTFRTDAGYSYGFLDDQKLPPSNVTVPLGPVAAHRQSFVRIPMDKTPSDRMWFAWAWGPSGDEPAIGLTRLYQGEGSYGQATGNGEVAAVLRSPSPHPGGLQAIGSYLVNVREREEDGNDNNFLESFDVSNPTGMFRYASVNTFTAFGIDRMASVGVTRTDDGGILLVAQRSTTASESDGTRTFYVMRADDLRFTNLRVLARHKGAEHDLDPARNYGPSENLSLITDCETGRVYAIGSSGSEYLKPDAHDSGVNDWRLYLVGEELEMIAKSNKPTFSSRCNARAGGTAFVDRHGRIHFYCSDQRWSDYSGGGDFVDSYPLSSGIQTFGPPSDG